MKLQDFGELFLDKIAEQCLARGLTRDNFASMSKGHAVVAAKPVRTEERVPRSNARRDEAFECFETLASVEEVATKCGVTRATAMEYLCSYIKERNPSSISHWLPNDVYERTKLAIASVGKDRLKPIYLELDEQVSYDHIRLVLAHIEAVSAAG
jgi:hypothetical protein